MDRRRGCTDADSIPAGLLEQLRFCKRQLSALRHDDPVSLLLHLPDCRSVFVILLFHIGQRPQRTEQFRLVLHRDIRDRRKDGIIQCVRQGQAECDSAGAGIDLCGGEPDILHTALCIGGDRLPQGILGMGQQRLVYAAELLYRDNCVCQTLRQSFPQRVTALKDRHPHRQLDHHLTERKFEQYHFENVCDVLGIQFHTVDERNRNTVFFLQRQREVHCLLCFRMAGIQHHGKRLSDLVQFRCDPLLRTDVIVPRNIPDRPV